MMTLMTSHSFITLNKNSVWRFWPPDILRALTAEAEEIRHKKTKNINLLSMCTRTRVCSLMCSSNSTNHICTHTHAHTQLCCVVLMKGSGLESEVQRLIQGYVTVCVCVFIDSRPMTHSVYHTHVFKIQREQHSSTAATTLPPLISSSRSFFLHPVFVFSLSLACYNTSFLFFSYDYLLLLLLPSPFLLLPSFPTTYLLLIPSSSLLPLLFLQTPLFSFILNFPPPFSCFSSSTFFYPFPLLFFIHFSLCSHNHTPLPLLPA